MENSLFQHKNNQFWHVSSSDLSRPFCIPHGNYMLAHVKMNRGPSAATRTCVVRFDWVHLTNPSLTPDFLTPNGDQHIINIYPFSCLWPTVAISTKLVTVKCKGGQLEVVTFIAWDRIRNKTHPISNYAAHMLSFPSFQIEVETHLLFK